MPPPDPDGAVDDLQLSLLRINQAGRPVSIGDIVATVEPEPNVVRPSASTSYYVFMLDTHRTHGTQSQLVVHAQPRLLVLMP